jgi:hypothetical protein
MRTVVDPLDLDSTRSPVLDAVQGIPIDIIETLQQGCVDIQRDETILTIY